MLGEKQDKLVQNYRKKPHDDSSNQDNDNSYNNQNNQNRFGNNQSPIDIPDNHDDVFNTNNQQHQQQRPNLAPNSATNLNSGRNISQLNQNILHNPNTQQVNGGSGNQFNDLIRNNQQSNRLGGRSENENLNHNVQNQTSRVENNENNRNEFTENQTNNQRNNERELVRTIRATKDREKDKSKEEKRRAKELEVVNKCRAKKRQRLPPRFDWRDQGKVTPARYQGKCGSCWTFTAIAALESAYLIKGKIQNENFDLSEQELLSCARKNGCKGGTAVDAYNYMLEKKGIVGETNWPYSYRVNFFENINNFI